MRSQTGVVECKQCRNKKAKIRGEYRSHGVGHWFVDASGKRWYGRICPECHQHNEWVRFGRRSIDKAKYHTARKGRMSERLVAEHYRSLGYAVELTRVRGPDIVATKGRHRITCEVKSLSPSGRCGRFWRTAPVSPTRRRDDVVAYVFPSGSIQIVTMKEHLRCASASGYRSFRILDGYGPGHPQYNDYNKRYSDDDVREIRRLRHDGLSFAAIAKIKGGNPGSVARIANGLRRADVV